MFRHEKYEVWRKSVDFSVFVTKLTFSFPETERYGLISQIRRASVSVPSNIAEGSGRNSDEDFSRFVGIAYGSLMEVLTCAEIAHQLKYMDKINYLKVRSLAEEIARMMSGLRAQLKRKKALSAKL
jgi:four helix bundle protein